MVVFLKVFSIDSCLLSTFFLLVATTIAAAGSSKDSFLHFCNSFCKRGRREEEKMMMLINYQSCNIKKWSLHLEQSFFIKEPKVRKLHSFFPFLHKSICLFPIKNTWCANTMTISKKRPFQIKDNILSQPFLLEVCFTFKLDLNRNIFLLL